MFTGSRNEPSTYLQWGWGQHKSAHNTGQNGVWSPFGFYLSLTLLFKCWKRNPIPFYTMNFDILSVKHWLNLIHSKCKHRHSIYLSFKKYHFPHWINTYLRTRIKYTVIKDPKSQMSQSPWGHCLQADSLLQCAPPDTSRWWTNEAPGKLHCFKLAAG